ncbi:MAG: DUF485 domain-containing protein [Kibdelosporangium sp.]
MDSVKSLPRHHHFDAQEPEPPAAADIDFAAVQQSEQFTEVRRRLLRFTFPMTALFLFWYLSYVLLAAYAHDFMSQQVFGKVNVGLLLGLSQFATTVAIMAAYLRFARKRVDPHTAEMRDTLGAGRR